MYNLWHKLVPFFAGLLARTQMHDGSSFITGCLIISGPLDLRLTGESRWYWRAGDWWGHRSSLGRITPTWHRKSKVASSCIKRDPKRKGNSPEKCLSNLDTRSGANIQGNKQFPSKSSLSHKWGFSSRRHKLQKSAGDVFYKWKLFGGGLHIESTQVRMQRDLMTYMCKGLLLDTTYIHLLLCGLAHVWPEKVEIKFSPSLTWRYDMTL